MRTSTISLFLVFLCVVDAHSQDYRVLYAKNARNANRKKIETGDVLSRNDIVVIKKNGNIALDVESKIDLILGEGRHNIDSINKLHTIRYQNHDSLKNVLQKRGLLDCQSKLDAWIVPGANRSHFSPNRIHIFGGDIKSVKPDSTKAVSIKWKNPDKDYKGNYLVIVQDAFNKAYLTILETEESSVSFYPGKYDHQYMLYSIRAEDCRGSAIYGIEVSR